MVVVSRREPREQLIFEQGLSNYIVTNVLSTNVATVWQARHHGKYMATGRCLPIKKKYKMIDIFKSSKELSGRSV